jgi:hypothetical protein
LVASFNSPIYGDKIQADASISKYILSVYFSIGGLGLNVAQFVSIRCKYTHYYINGKVFFNFFWQKPQNVASN